MPSESATPRLVLYGPRDTPYVVKAERALRWKKLPFETVEPTSREDYRRWSPVTGLLPVLEIDGERVHDSSLILDALDRRFPEPPLLSADPRVAREQRRLESWITESFSFYIMRWVRSRFPGDDGADAAAPLGRMSSLGLIGDDGQVVPGVFDTSDGGPGPEFARRLDDLVAFLGERPYFYADRLSRADLTVFSSVAGMAADLYPGGRDLLEERPRLLAHHDRVDQATR
jgi:glutathione S-transferase